jgi:GNAT superfamily N-acetyltransferase
VLEKEDNGSVVAEPEVVTLRDGTNVSIRTIRPDDAPRLQALFDRLSQESVFFRFLAHQKTLSDEQAQDLADVDYHMRMALVASLEHEGEEQVVAVARYAVIREGAPDLAEAAFVVEDRFQGRGLGKLLLKRLIAYARRHGIRDFWMSVHHRNSKMMSLVRGTGLPIKTRNTNLGIWEIEMVLEPEVGPQRSVEGAVGHRSN